MSHGAARNGVAAGLLSWSAWPGTGLLVSCSVEQVGLLKSMHSCSAVALGRNMGAAEADAVPVQNISEAQFSCKITVAFLCFIAFGY